MRRIFASAGLLVLLSIATIQAASAHPVVDSPDDGNPTWCLNPSASCAQGGWWTATVARQTSNLVQYGFVGPGLTTEDRYREVVLLLWQWPEGRSLLGAGSDAGVAIVSGNDDDVYAVFDRQPKAVRINRDFAHSSTWMLADVVAHELKHVADHAASIYDSRSFSDCIAREQRAYAVEQRFLRWISNRFGGLPDVQDVSARYTPADFDLFENLYTLRFSPDPGTQALNDYRGHCQ